eukprot:12911198-Prorocentrum_lima.AAC.1
MRPVHREAILRAANLLYRPHHFVQVDAAAWTTFPRRRLLLSTLLPPTQVWQPDRRPVQW